MQGPVCSSAYIGHRPTLSRSFAILRIQRIKTITHTVFFKQRYSAVFCFLGLWGVSERVIIKHPPAIGGRESS